jgi:hypothetical protein
MAKCLVKLIEMAGDAEWRYQDRKVASFILSGISEQVADYGFSSGIFNVRLGERIFYLETTLRAPGCTSLLGFTFNFLTSYSEIGKEV